MSIDALRRAAVRAAQIGGGCALVLLSWGADPAIAQGKTLQGVWRVTITPVDCATGIEAPQFAFRALLTFYRDGTSMESVATASLAPGQRSVGHGVWKHAGGHVYGERTLAMVLFSGGIYQAGWQEITRTITMTDRDHYTGTGFSELFNMDGESYRVNCANSVGERFE